MGMRTILIYLGGLLLAALAGALGGALVGVGESILVSWTSAAADEYWMVLFGAVAYGLIGPPSAWARRWRGCCCGAAAPTIASWPRSRWAAR
jgi:hypothetical protein